MVLGSGLTAYTPILHNHALVYVDDVVQGFVSRMDLSSKKAVVKLSVPSISKGH